MPPSAPAASDPATLTLARTERVSFDDVPGWVEVAFSGVCQTQILEARGHRGVDEFLPHCLGHEGSGLVMETGPSFHPRSGT